MTPNVLFPVYVLSVEVNNILLSEPHGHRLHFPNILQHIPKLLLDSPIILHQIPQMILHQPSIDPERLGVDFKACIPSSDLVDLICKPIHSLTDGVDTFCLLVEFFAETGDGPGELVHGH